MQTSVGVGRDGFVLSGWMALRMSMSRSDVKTKHQRVSVGIVACFLGMGVLLCALERLPRGMPPRESSTRGMLRVRAKNVVHPWQDTERSVDAYRDRRMI